MGLFGRSNADKIADNVREQAKFILLQLNGIDEVFCRDGGATLYNVKVIVIPATDSTNAQFHTGRVG